MLFNMMGGTAVQTASGSVRTDRNGSATIECGFRPDLVAFRVSTFTSDGATYENLLVLPIALSENEDVTTLNNLTWANADWDIMECWPTAVTDTGITCEFYGYDASWNGGYATYLTLPWVAVKYT